MEKRCHQKDKYESLIIDQTHHFSMTECSIVLPFEFEMFIWIEVPKALKLFYSFNPFILPSPRCVNIFQLFILLWLKYLHKQGFVAQGMELDQIDK